jgi:uncharacterized protein with PIN domain
MSTSPTVATVAAVVAVASARRDLVAAPPAFSGVPLIRPTALHSFADHGARQLAVPCPRCRREYDVTLFAFGRTIWCACGTRVGVEPRVYSIDGAAAKRFSADSMLARLARWLRLLGFDCAYDGAVTDAALVRRAVEEKRTLLTRDRKLSDEWWVPNIYVVTAENLRDQLLEVIRRFDLARSIAVLSRCNACDQPVRPIAADAVRDRVPPRVVEAHHDFSTCPRCGRVFWEGTHATRIRRVVDELLADL